MRPSKLILLLNFITCFPSFAQDLYVIRNVNVIPMNREGMLTDRNVWVKDGKILRLDDGKSKIEAAASIIDGTGKYLIPGLMDMHTHFFQEQGEHKNTNDLELKLMLANGLTTCRILAGHPSYLAARDSVKQGIWQGPDLFVASPQFVGRWPWPPEFKNFEVVDTPLKAEEAVKKFKREGYDAIKITFMVGPEVYDAILRTGKEVGIPVTGHVGPKVKLPRALKTGQQIEHMDEFIDMLLPDTSYNHGISVSDMNIWSKPAWETVPYLDESRIPALAASVKAAGIYVTPTNYFFTSSFGRNMSNEEAKELPDFQFIPSYIQADRWRVKKIYERMMPSPGKLEKYVKVRNKMVYELWKAGVPLMAGSDSPEWFLVQGFSLHKELEAFVKAGLSPYAALQTATLNTAKYLGIDKEKGSIEPGKVADMVLLSKNPLEDIRNTQTIDGLFKKGKWFSADAISGLLKDAKALGN